MEWGGTGQGGVEWGGVGQGGVEWGGVGWGGVEWCGVGWGGAGQGRAGRAWRCGPVTKWDEMTRHGCLPLRALFDVWPIQVGHTMARYGLSRQGCLASLGSNLK